MSKEGEKPKLTKEQIEALMKHMVAQGANKGKPQNQSKFAIYFNQFLIFLSKFVKHIDQLINFIVKPQGSDRNDVVQYARAPVVFGAYVIIIFFGIGFLWASFAPLSSAAGATGVLVNDSHRQLIQNSHPGIVKAIFVKLGDRVKKGQKLLEIEEISNKSKYEQALNHYRNAIANVARLNAEKEDADDFIFPQELLDQKDNLEVQKLMDNQKKLFNARKEAYRSKIVSLSQKKEQILKQLDSFKSKKISLAKQVVFFKSRLDAQRELLKEGHTTKSNLDKAEVEYEQHKSDSLTNDNEISKLDQALLQDESELKSYQSEYLSNILKELKEISSNAYNYGEELKTLKDVLNREIIVSPVDGIVNVINVHTIGGYIGNHYQQGASGAAIMEITPDNEKLVIDARIPQSKIAYVHVGLDAVIRFSAFKSRTSPSFKGKIVAMSSDAIEDQKSLQMLHTKGMSDDSSFYPAKIEIDMDDFNKLTKGKDLKLQPGMRAEIMIITGKRTLLRYLLDPITDTAFRALKEK